MTIIRRGIQRLEHNEPGGSRGPARLVARLEVAHCPNGAGGRVGCSDGAVSRLVTDGGSIRSAPNCWGRAGGVSVRAGLTGGAPRVAAGPVGAAPPGGSGWSRSCDMLLPVD